MERSNQRGHKVTTELTWSAGGLDWLGDHVSLWTGIGWPTKCTSSGPPPVCSCTRWPRASARRSTSTGSGPSHWTRWGNQSSTTTTTPWSTSTRPAPVRTPCPWSSGRWAHCTDRGRSASTPGPVTLRGARRRSPERNSRRSDFLLYFLNPVNGMTFFYLELCGGFFHCWVLPFDDISMATSEIMRTFCGQLVMETLSRPPAHLIFIRQSISGFCSPQRGSRMAANKTWGIHISRAEQNQPPNTMEYSCLLISKARCSTFRGINWHKKNGTIVRISHWI